MRFNTFLLCNDDVLRFFWFSIVVFWNRKSRRAVVTSARSANWFIFWRCLWLDMCGSKSTKTMGMYGILYYVLFWISEFLSKWVQTFCFSYPKFIIPPSYGADVIVVTVQLTAMSSLRFAGNGSDCEVPNHFLKNISLFKHRCTLFTLCDLK